MDRALGSPRRELRRIASLCVAVALGVLASSASRAHEIGALRARAEFSAGGSYQIEVRVDTQHLPPELRPASGASDPAGPEGLREFRARFLQGAEIAFDGEPIALAPEPQPANADASLERDGSRSAPSEQVFRFAGVVPRGARSFTWGDAMPLGTYALEIVQEGDPQSHWQWVESGQRSAPFGLRHAQPPLHPGEVFLQYIELGYTHIVPDGIDHILFVLGLFLLSLRWKTLLRQVTAFTLAHSITLALTTYGFVSLSPRIVEPLIALSIVYVAIENIFVREARPARVAIVFCFGLLHGMGFAGVLRELGLPRSDFMTALVAFNFGVEAGQLSVIALAFATVGFWFREKSWYRRWLTVPASAAISCVGLYWTFERVLL